MDLQRKSNYTRPQTVSNFELCYKMQLDKLPTTYAKQHVWIVFFPWIPMQKEQTLINWTAAIGPQENNSTNMGSYQYADVPIA